MKNMFQKGFTLIELLVVITIIGILATGAVTVYTGQMTKARDSTRLSDVKALQGAVEQAYLENYVYPSNGSGFSTDVGNFMARLPRDPRSAGIAGGSATDYLYIGADDGAATQLNNQRYELSVSFEGTSGVPNVTGDLGNDPLRHEVGTKNTQAPALTTARTAPILLAATMGQCFAATGVAAACVPNTTAVLIR